MEGSDSRAAAVVRRWCSGGVPTRKIPKSWTVLRVATTLFLSPLPVSPPIAPHFPALLLPPPSLSPPSPRCQLGRRWTDLQHVGVQLVQRKRAGRDCRVVAWNCTRVASVKGRRQAVKGSGRQRQAVEGSERCGRGQHAAIGTAPLFCPVLAACRLPSSLVSRLSSLFSRLSSFFSNFRVLHAANWNG